MKIDPYNTKERYTAWSKEALKKGIEGLSGLNSSTVLEYLTDMENGLNIANGSKKGSRSYIRLSSIKQRIIFLCKQFENLYDIKDITKLTESTLLRYFSGSQGFFY